MWWDFPGNTVVKNPAFNAGDLGLILGTKIPYASGQLSPWSMTTEPEHPAAGDPSTREARMLQTQRPVHRKKEPAWLEEDKAQPKKQKTHVIRPKVGAREGWHFLVETRGSILLLGMLRRGGRRAISMTYPSTPFKSVTRLFQIPLSSLFIIRNLSRWRIQNISNFPGLHLGTLLSSGSN